MTDIDAKALEAAVIAYDEARCAAHGGDQPMSARNRETITPMIEAAIRAYCAAALPVERASLREKLKDWADMQATDCCLDLESLECLFFSGPFAAPSVTREIDAKALEAAAKAMERQIDYRFVSQKYDGWESFTDVQRRMFRAAAEAAIRAYLAAAPSESINAPAPPDTTTLVRAIEAVRDAGGAYLPPDGIDAKAALSRVLAAVDNPEINDAMKRATPAGRRAIEEGE